MDRCPKIEYGRLFGEIGWLGVNRGIVSAKRGQAVQLKKKKGGLVVIAVISGGGPGNSPRASAGTVSTSPPSQRSQCGWPSHGRVRLGRAA